MRTCENCSIRKQYAKCFDVHFDWRDCPYACEYAKEQVKEETELIESYIYGIKELPTHVKHGKWIKMSDADGVYWACSECGEALPRVLHFNQQFDLFPRVESIDRTDYCPKCGTKMDEDSQKMHSR